jgi:prophage antirepressor-like protein
MNHDKNKKEVFFMEIFNEILKLNDNDIVIVYDKNSNVWFGLRDVVKALEYNNYRNAVTKLRISKENIKKYKAIRGTTLMVPLNMQPHTKFINESGLYELLSISTKPLARLFMDKYFSHIMPEIRKNGQYILNKQEKNKTDEINKELEQENIELKNNLRNIVYPVGSALYLITKIVHNKKYYKLGFTKNLNKRLKVYNTSQPNKIFYNYFIMVKNKHIDSCMKNIMKNNEFIKNKEFYLAKLSRILEFIKSCEKSLDKIYCGYCLKCYIFNKIKLHKCKYIIN